MKVRTRFAPSPTGFLHVGGLRTALYNFLFAKQNKGDFVLRIEDTDQNRLIDQAESNLQSVLKQCQLIFDEGPKNGALGPYTQSNRLDIYKKHVLKLLHNGSAYACFFKVENPTTLCPEKNISITLDKIKNNIPYVIKLSIPKKGIIIARDEIRGDIKFDLNLLDDPIIMKSDGFPTYHLANVIDDHLMKISHVIRGEEWLPSLPIHMLLYESFNWNIPKFYHLPLLLNKDKSKLSKRQGDVTVDDLLAKGYLMQAIINFVALLGWHPANNQEIFSLKQLIKEFSINRIIKSGAVFDIEKLNWMNSVYLKNCTTESLLPQVQKILENKRIFINDKDKLYKIVEYGKNRINKLTDIVEETKIFYKDIEYDKTILEKFNNKDLFKLWHKELSKINDLNSNSIKNIVEITSREMNISGKNLFFPIRVALIGQTHGPDLYTIINILGKKESLERIENVS